jgi:hypothetical protein
MLSMVATAPLAYSSVMPSVQASRVRAVTMETAGDLKTLAEAANPVVVRAR